MFCYVRTLLSAVWWLFKWGQYCVVCDVMQGEIIESHRALIEYCCLCCFPMWQHLYWSGHDARLGQYCFDEVLWDRIVWGFCHARRENCSPADIVMREMRIVLLWLYDVDGVHERCPSLISSSDSDHKTVVWRWDLWRCVLMLSINSIGPSLRCSVFRRIQVGIWVSRLHPGLLGMSTQRSGYCWFSVLAHSKLIVWVSVN